MFVALTGDQVTISSFNIVLSSFADFTDTGGFYSSSDFEFFSRDCFKYSNNYGYINFLFCHDSNISLAIYSLSVLLYGCLLKEQHPQSDRFPSLCLQWLICFTDWSVWTSKHHRFTFLFLIQIMDCAYWITRSFMLFPMHHSSHLVMLHFVFFLKLFYCIPLR